MTETTKLTKLHFDRALASLRGMVGAPPAWEGELTRFHKRDQPYAEMQQRFRIENADGLLGAPVELVGWVAMDTERKAIRLYANLRAIIDGACTTVERPSLRGDYDVYTGQWHLRWVR